MSEVSVESTSISSAIKLCHEAQNQLRMTTHNIRKSVESIRSCWNDKKCDEFVKITEKCSDSLFKPIKGLEECTFKLREISSIIEEYNEVSLSVGNVSHNSDSVPETASLSIDDCNAALIRDGMNEQMVDISNVAVEGLSEEGFWSHHGHSEAEWQEAMGEYSDMMQDYSNGMSIERCYDQYPHAASMFFGKKDPIRLSYFGGSLLISGGRHRIAMAQRLGIRYLPAIVY